MNTVRNVARENLLLGKLILEFDDDTLGALLADAVDLRKDGRIARGDGPLERGDIGHRKDGERGLRSDAGDAHKELEERQLLAGGESVEIDGVVANRSVDEELERVTFAQFGVDDVGRRHADLVADAVGVEEYRSVPGFSSIASRELAYHSLQLTASAPGGLALPEGAFSGRVLRMAITKSAKKALRQSKRRKVFNERRMRALRNAVRLVRSGEGKTEANLSAAYKAIDKAAKRGVIKKNTAARKKSQLAKLLKK